MVVAGDLFDVWVTPAQAEDPGLRPVFAALAGLAASGVDCAFVEGNRDFAAGDALRDCGVRTLPDEVVLDGAGARVAITHGDLLCRRDVRYQAFRRVARSGLVRSLLRAAPSRVASSVGDAARAGSRIETSRKAYGDMGLDPVAVASLFRRTGADVLVCGHVHWGRRHAIEVDGLRRDVIVLGAWDSGDASYARIADDGVAFLRWTGADPPPAPAGAPA